MSQASVRSIDALRDFRAALIEFAEDALGALGAADMETRRTVHWVTHEQRLYWQEQLKRRKELLSQAHSELARKKLGASSGNTPRYTEQLEQQKKAKARLEEAERRAELLKRWEPRLQQAVLEYKGRAGRLSDLIGGDLPRSLALLDRIIEALDAYAQVAPPSGAAAASGFARVMAESVSSAPTKVEPALVVPPVDPEPTEPTDQEP
ncbi:MAG: hypothetical protein ABI353_10890 [Isosphaeraceae bacterium]